ncbi:hypothetical protein LshimejAT787_0310250 [Lyophyllum shimeji]|uniref:Uncharacterized protein n=1 Tax=Lyophyllum shimeji TaxID=47721 RepID=A0A9P3PJR5_LYOSH|nr:hypothetical protein LshimejAT787_0310250 [Lyophyllum shimeji]
MDCLRSGKKIAAVWRRIWAVAAGRADIQRKNGLGKKYLSIIKVSSLISSLGVPSGTSYGQMSRSVLSLCLSPNVHHGSSIPQSNSTSFYWVLFDSPMSHGNITNTD